MIPFFRNTRKKLADDNKPMKYARYAVGEIVLVVVGILIALSINNWNEERKTNGIVQNYYSQLLKDLEKDSAYIQRQIIRLDHNIKLYDVHIEVLKQEDLDTTGLINSFLTLDYGFWHYIFNTNTIETLQSTGDIKLMSSQIRNMLIDLKRSQAQRLETTRGNNSEGLRKLMDALSLGAASDLHRVKFLQKKIEGNYDTIFLTLQAASSLKNSTEQNSLKRFKVMLSDIEKLSAVIKIQLQ
jgi:hypothetical protein